MKAIEFSTAPGDGERLNAIVDALAATRSKIAALQAEEARLLYDALGYALDRMDEPGTLTDRPRDLPLRSVAAQIATATRQSDRTVQSHMSEAHALVAHFPATWNALRAGTISRAHASVITDAASALGDAEARGAYEEDVLPIARQETAGRLRPAAKRLAQQHHPVPFEERHRAARAQRRIWVTDLDDGMAEFGMIAPAHLARGAFERATGLAQGIIAAREGDRGIDTTHLEGTDALPAPDTRRLDEVRADVVCELLLTADPGADGVSVPEDALRANIQITIPVLALLGLSDEPAQLAGHGPMDPETARRLAASAPGWDRILTHPITETVLTVDRYRPTPEQRRLLGLRDEHCRFPGCRQPTGRCDIDHTVAHAEGGSTDVRNLAHLCRRHHTLKHHSAWRVRQRPGGILEWTSPTGRVYDDKPARTLVFEPAPF